jgi:hypothetical protein
LAVDVDKKYCGLAKKRILESSTSAPVERPKKKSTIGKRDKR